MYKINYAQNYRFDTIGNMTLKTSTETTTPRKTAGASLNYTPYGEQWVEQVGNGADSSTREEIKKNAEDVRASNELYKGVQIDLQ
jgi:hypothetical protein